jgi:hypothetical protein
MEGQREAEEPWAVGPTREEVEAWAEQERKRRAAWMAGPTEREKSAWARYERRRRIAREAYDPDDPYADDWETVRMAQRLRRDAELASEGALYCLFDGPFWLWARLLRAGLDWEERGYRPSRRRRISFSDDDF